MLERELRPNEVAAMARARTLAARGPVAGPNPRVGCVILGPRGIVAEGWHRGAGTPHAEVAALEALRGSGLSPAGLTAVVTLEPCRHTGRTGPCTEALLTAGIGRVVYSVPDPDPIAGGGAEVLRAGGVDVLGPVLQAEGEAVLGDWLVALRLGRPVVTVKLAMSLDGRIAAADGTSQWITSPQSRAHAHAYRATVDAIAVGTGTVLADNPALTARPVDDASTEPDRQPLRIVLGRRDLPADARVRGDGRFRHLRSHDPGEVLDALWAEHIRTVLVEGGATVSAAFLTAGLVDRLHVYLAPVLLGAGRSAVDDLGIGTLADASRWRITHTDHLGPDLFLAASPAGTPTAGPVTTDLHADRPTTGPSSDATPTMGRI